MNESEKIDFALLDLYRQTSEGNMVRIRDNVRW